MTDSTSSAFASRQFWQIPLDFSCLEDQKSEDEGAERSGAPSKRLTPSTSWGGASTAAPTSCGIDYWRLPLPAADGSLLSSDEDEDRPQACAASVPVGSMVATNSLAAEHGQAEQTEAAALAHDDAGVEAPAPKPRPRLSLQELRALLDRSDTWQEQLDARMRLLQESQSQLSTLLQQSRKQDQGPQQAQEQSTKRMDGLLPPEISERFLCWLDVRSLLVAATTCREWAPVGPRWRTLGLADWGDDSCRSRRDYRTKLDRWRGLRQCLTSLQGSPASASVIGSPVRKRLFKALETLAEMISAPSPGAKYPSEVLELVRSTDGIRLLLALLEDESPHPRLLSVRCLADLAAHESERSEIRPEIVSHGALVRMFLEDEDADLVEAGSRLMINLHGSTPGVPLSARRRGPAGFGAHAGVAGSDAGLARASKGRAGSSASLDAWTGVWTGEMRYARGGERHSTMRLVLGPYGDPAIEQATEAFQDFIIARHRGDGGSGLSSSGGEAGGFGGREADAGGSSSTGAHPSTQPGRNMRAEGDGAAFWNYFGFLASSDFDCADEASRYIDEQIARRRTVRSPAQGSAPTRLPALVGAGWDEQNGAFTVEGTLRPSTSAPSTSPVLAGASPVFLRLRYESRRSTLELTGFLAEGRADVQGQAHPCMLYGVWATAPSHHKHLFALQRIAGASESTAFLPSAGEPWDVRGAGEGGAASVCGPRTQVRQE